MELRTTINTYHNYLIEANLALRLGMELHDKLKDNPAIGNNYISGNLENMNAKYAFLMIANSIEAAANALLLHLELDNEYYDELEKMPTLVKLKIYCSMTGRRLDTGNVLYARVKEIIECRNQFVHPKPKQTQMRFDENSGELDYGVKKTKNRSYSYHFNDVKQNQALIALDDVLKFFSWLMFDICGYDQKTGAFILGINSYGVFTDIEIIEKKYNLKFDKRTFNDPPQL